MNVKYINLVVWNQDNIELRPAVNPHNSIL